MREVKAHTQASPGAPFPADLSARIERFAIASGVDPDNVPALHSHRNPVTGQIASASWPCPQCIALGRTEPLRHGRDFPDEGGPGPAVPIPPERLDAYLATFPPLDEDRRPQPVPAPVPRLDRAAARRKARRKAERQGRRRNR